MNIVIAGGGKVGFYLVKTILPFKHDITLIEIQKDICIRNANELRIPVVKGDATNIEHLSEANVQMADVFIAVTGKDEVNLIACQLAKRKLNVKRTIARINNPKNMRVFEKLGVDFAVGSTSVIAELIEREIDFSGVKTLLRLKSGKTVISEVEISNRSPVSNKSLKECNIPKNCIVISVIREEEVIIPNGNTIIKEKDTIITISSKEDQDELRDFFLGAMK